MNKTILSPRAANCQVASEADIQKAILGYLSIRGVLHWRINTGASKYKTAGGKDRFVKYGHPGMSDIIGILPGGRFLAIEVKAAKGRLSPLQVEYMAEVNKSGGLAFMARSVQDVVSQIGY